MTRDIQDIPPAVRHVHWSAVLWIRWPVALLGGTMVLLGSLWTGVLFLGSLGGRAGDERLDREAVVANGQVESVESVRYVDGVPWSTIRYSVSSSPRIVHQCMVKGMAEDLLPAATCSVEFLPTEPGINRILGGRRTLIPNWARPEVYLGLLVFPGFLLLCLWAQGMFDARRLLADGDVSVGQLLDVRRLGWISPTMIAVTYQFRDHRAEVRTARHWVRARSAVGHRIFEGEERLPVLVHRRWPRLSRLAVPADFAGSRRPVADAVDGASLEA